MNFFYSMTDFINSNPKTRPILGGTWLLAYILKGAIPEHTIAHKAASLVFELLGGAAVVSLGASHIAKKASPSDEG